MSIENGISKFLHSSGVLCVVKRHTSLERKHQVDSAIDILLLWSKGMLFEYGVGFICAQSGVPIAIRVSGLHLLLFFVPNPRCIYPYSPNRFATATKSKTLTIPSPFTSGASVPNPLATATKSSTFTTLSPLMSAIGVTRLR